MSEFNPFDAAVQEAPASPESVDEGAGSRRNVVLLGVLGAVVLGAGAFLFLGGGGEELDDFTPVTRAPRAAAPAASAAPAVKLPVTTKVALGRNPFRALYVQPPAAAAPAADAAGGSVADAGGSTTVLSMSSGDGGTLASPTAQGGTPTGGGAGTADAPRAQEPTAKEHKLVLRRVFGTGKDQSAVFTIDGKQQTAKVGSTFGPTAEILLLSLQQGPKDDQWTAVLQVGDSDPFDAILGEPVFVR